MQIQNTQSPTFKGKIKSLRKFELSKDGSTGMISIGPLSREENKQLRPLVHYLKHHTAGEHAVTLQRIIKDSLAIQVSTDVSGSKGNGNMYICAPGVPLSTAVQKVLAMTKKRIAEEKIEAKQVKAKKAEAKPRKSKSLLTRIFDSLRQKLSK